MEIIDAQIHTWLSDRPSRPWIAGYRIQNRERLPLLIHAGQSLSPEAALTELAEAGVDAGVLSPVGVYGNDNGYELAAARRFPRKFCVVGWIDHLADDVEESLTREVELGMVGVRLLGVREAERLERSEFDPLLEACQRLGCAVAVSLSHPLPDLLFDLLVRYEGVNFLIDHLGLGLAPPTLGPAPVDAFANLPAVLRLAELLNVSLKLTGAPSLSHELYPFRDIWPAVQQILESFGPERVMWGSDFTRTSGLHSYWEATHYLAQIDGLDDATLEQIYGHSLRSILRWDPDPHAHPLRPS
jgi:predicted TIM-barrel fold metal-dependent hydrolase